MDNRSRILVASVAVAVALMGFWGHGLWVDVAHGASDDDTSFGRTNTVVSATTHLKMDTNKQIVVFNFTPELQRDQTVQTTFKAYSNDVEVQFLYEGELVDEVLLTMQYGGGGNTNTFKDNWNELYELNPDWTNNPKRWIKRAAQRQGRKIIDESNP